MIKSNRGGKRTGSGRKTIEPKDRRRQFIGSCYISEKDILARFETLDQAKQAANQAIKNLFHLIEK